MSNTMNLNKMILRHVPNHSTTNRHLIRDEDSSQELVEFLFDAAKVKRICIEHPRPVNGSQKIRSKGKAHALTIK